MEISGCYWGRESEEMLEFIPKVAEYFKSIRLSYWIRGLKNREVIEKLKEYREKYGINYNIHMTWVGLDQSSLLENIRKASVQEAKEAIDFLQNLGGGALNFHLSLPPRFFDSRDREQIRLQELKSFQEITAYAKDKNVLIVIENVPSGPEVSHNYEGSRNFKSHIFLLENIPDKHFGVNFDTGHFHQHSHTETMDIKELFNKIGKRILYVHAHDNDGTRDSHMAVGRGTFDWELFLDLLNEYDFNGTVELELTKLEDQLESKKFLTKLRPSYFNP